MLKNLIATLFLFIAVPCFAQDVPVQKIEGAESPIPLGDVVFLNVSKPVNAPANLNKFVVDWKVFDGGKPKQFRKMPDGSIFFGSGVKAKKIQVFACVSYLYLNKEGEVIKSADTAVQLLTTEVTLGDGTPVPPPEPDPSVVFPDGKYKLAATAYKLAMERIAADDRKAGPYLSVSFKGVSSRIAAGTLIKIEDILVATTEVNRDALTKLSMDHASWESFFIGLQDVIYQMYVDKKLVTTDDFVIAWNEISQGLAKVK